MKLQERVTLFQQRLQLGDDLRIGKVGLADGVLRALGHAATTSVALGRHHSGCRAH